MPPIKPFDEAADQLHLHASTSTPSSFAYTTVAAQVQPRSE